MREKVMSECLTSAIWSCKKRRFLPKLKVRVRVVRTPTQRAVLGMLTLMFAGGTGRVLTQESNVSASRTTQKPGGKRSSITFSVLRKMIFSLELL